MLVAEDDEALRPVLERGLREHGYVVDDMPDGERALGFLRTYDLRCGGMGLAMPNVSGLDMIRELRRAGSPVPILMLTARDRAGACVAGLDEGADDYLVKPFNRDDEADALGSNTIDVHLPRLRAKLVGERVRIETVRGIGYRMAAT